MKNFGVAIVGATGMVGRTFLKVLEEKNFKNCEYFLFASKKSAGKELDFAGKKRTVIELSEKNVRALEGKVDFALFSAGAGVSGEYAPIFCEIGATVVDNSSRWRMEKAVPLVVPEVNAQDILPSSKLIANPNCSTIQAVVAIKPLADRFGLKRVVYSTYQAVSGAGMRGYLDLKDGEQGLPPKKFPHPIYSNVLPHIDVFNDDGYTKEEKKMIDETRKILHMPTLKVTATTARVPVFNCHSESINLEFEEPCTLDEVKKTLAHAPGVVLSDDIKNNVYPMPIIADGKDEVFVGRVRIDESVYSGVNLWVVADNIRKGAATNAVQIMEYIMSRM